MWAQLGGPRIRPVLDPGLVLDETWERDALALGSSERERLLGYELRFEASRVIGVLARESDESARDHLTRYLDAVERSTTPPGERTELLRQVMDVLGERTGFGAQIKRACDLAAAAILERLTEMHRFAVESTPYFEVTEEDHREVRRIKDAFIAQHDEFKKAVARQFAANASLRRDWLQADDVLCLCAWCDRAKHADGTWVPTASLLPSDGRLRVSHGLCPDCHTDEFAKGSRQ